MALRSLCFVSALLCTSCSKEAPPPPATAAASAAASTPPASTSTASTEATAAPSTASPPLTVAALRAEAAANPERLLRTDALLDGYVSGLRQRTFGSHEHGVHSFMVVDVALAMGDHDTIACEITFEQSAPAGLRAGDPIAVHGVWSTERLVQGGSVPGVEPLHIARCQVAKR
jgi:hypothetical protein